MDWDDLKTFLAIARHGTLSGAARALGVTQPTMGRRLAAMEARSGARLLQRLPGRYALTSLGEAVLGNAERIEAEALAAERTITGRDVALEGVVRLTTVDTLAARIAAPALAALQCRHPGIVVELVPDTRQLSLSKREADIALRMSRFEGHEVAARRVGQMALGLYGTPDWQDRLKDGAVRLVTVLDDQAHLPEAKWLHQMFPDAAVGFRSNSREVQLWAAKSGAGIAALARYRADEEPDLVRFLPEAPDLVRDIWLGVHVDMRHMPRVRAVMDAITDTLRDRARVLNPSG
ncbi:MAG: LysR family transcriptional regulator [Chakrabartia godavariana]